MKLAEKMSRIGTESAFEVLAKARALEKQGKHIIHLEIGEPDFPTPAHVVEAGKRALDEGWTKYGPTQGFPELREAIAAYISRTRGITVGAENVCVVPGGKPIMYFLMMALLEPGDEVIYPDPSFPIYESLIHFLGATPVGVPVVESRGFSFDLERPFAAVGQDQARHPELSCQSDGRRHSEGRHRADGRHAARPRRHRPQRRDLFADLVRDASRRRSPASTGCWTRRSSSTVSPRRTR